MNSVSDLVSIFDLSTVFDPFLKIGAGLAAQANAWLGSALHMMGLQTNDPGLFVCSVMTIILLVGVFSLGRRPRRPAVHAARKSLASQRFRRISAK